MTKYAGNNFLGDYLTFSNKIENHGYIYKLGVLIYDHGYIYPNPDGSYFYGHGCQL